MLRRARRLLELTIILAMLCAAGAMLARPAPQSRTAANAWLAQGIGAYRAGHFAEARQDLEKAVQSDSRLAQAHAYLGLTFARTGNERGSLVELERAHTLDPQNPGYAYDTAILLIAAKQYPPAIAILEKLRQQEPASKDVLVNLARAEAGSGESAKLAALVSSLSASSYADPHFLEALAGVLAEAKQVASLEQLWKSAIRFAPDQPLPYAALAALWTGRGDANQALTLLDKTPAAARNPIYWYAYGQTQMALHQYSQAAHSFRRLTRLVPQNERARMRLIQAQVLDGRLSDAAVSADEALRRLPESAGLRYQAGLVNYLLGRDAAALAALAPLLASGAKHGDTRPVLLAAVIESASGRYKQAVEYFKEALRPPGPCNALAAYFYGATLLRMHQPAEAATQLKAAIACRPHFALAEYRLGLALVQDQHTEEAEVEFQDAIRDDPQLAEPYYALAQLRRRAGDAKGAAAALQKFTQLHQHADAADRGLLQSDSAPGK